MQRSWAAQCNPARGVFPGWHGEWGALSCSHGWEPWEAPALIPANCLLAGNGSAWAAEEKSPSKVSSTRKKKKNSTVPRTPKHEISIHWPTTVTVRPPTTSPHFACVTGNQGAGQSLVLWQWFFCSLYFSLIVHRGLLWERWECDQELHKVYQGILPGQPVFSSLVATLWAES